MNRRRKRASFEIVLPRLRDVRRRQAIVSGAAANGSDIAPASPEPVDLGSVDGRDGLIRGMHIKPEPMEEDSQPDDPHNAIQQLRNVGYPILLLLIGQKLKPPITARCEGEAGGIPQRRLSA